MLIYYSFLGPLWWVKMRIKWNMFLVIRIVSKSVNNSFELKWIECIFDECILIRFTVVATYVQVSVSIKSTIMFPLAQTPHPHTHSLRFAVPSQFLSQSFSLTHTHTQSHSTFLNDCNERRQNRRITEIIRFNYIYIHFCLSWINSSIRDFIAIEIVALFFCRMASTHLSLSLSLSECAAWSSQFTQ